MNKILKAVLPAIILCIVLTPDGIAQTKNYRAVIWKSTDIKDLLDKADVQYFEFNFNNQFLKAYKIFVTAFDKYGKVVGSSKLGFYRPQAKIALENSYADGLLTMKASDVKSYSTNGTTNLYFVPVPYDEKKAELLYVSYKVFNAPPDGAAAIDSYVTTIKPSPPYGR